MTNRDSTDFLDDILDYIDRIERFTNSLSFDNFKSDERTICAVVNCIEVIGEATKHIPESIRSRYPEIPWKDMAGIRDRIIHGYFKIDLEIIWQTATQELPEIKPLIERVKREL